jgi:hypothetical protein
MNKSAKIWIAIICALTLLIFIRMAFDYELAKLEPPQVDTEIIARLDSIESKLEARDNAEFAEVMAIIGGQVDSWRMDSEALNKYFEPYKRLGR